MKREEYENVILKISKMGRFADIHNCGYPTDKFPVNIYAETVDGNTKFYVALDWGEWSVQWTHNKNVSMRAKMNNKRGFKNQTECLDFVNRIICCEI